MPFEAGTMNAGASAPGRLTRGLELASPFVDKFRELEFWIANR